MNSMARENDIFRAITRDRRYILTALYVIGGPV
jgi:hypothetical protein